MSQCEQESKEWTPPAYYPSVVVAEGRGVEAIAWYKDALKAKEKAVYKNKDGTVMHAFLESEYGFPVAIEEATPKEHNCDPVDDPKRGSAMYMYINVQGSHKADDAVKSMKAAGAHVTHETRDLFYGHRVGRVVDSSACLGPLLTTSLVTAKIW